jgi:hypothetical protein
MPIQTIAVLISLFLCLWGAATAYAQVLRPMGLSPGVLWGGLVFVILFAIPMFFLHWLGQVIVDRNELAIHEKGVRWANSFVLFDQVDSVSMGTETFREKHFPTLNVLWKAHWRHGEGVRKAEEQERASTLAFHFKNGGVKQWRNFGRCFGPETLEEFFSEFGERV